MAMSEPGGTVDAKSHVTRPFLGTDRRGPDIKCNYSTAVCKAGIEEEEVP